MVPVSERVQVQTEDGEELTLRSRLEANIAQRLSEMRVAFGYESERLTYIVKHVYLPDFQIKSADGHTIHIEAKGFFSSEDRSKTLAILEQHPGIDLRFVFERATTKLNRGSKTSYGDWCDRHRLPWADGGEVPDSWLVELLG